MSKGSYWAFVLDETSRNALLTHIPPRFEDVICHHVTLAFGVPESAIQPVEGKLAVTPIWYVADDSLEAIVVHVEGYGLKRPDGKEFHITLSLDKGKGRKPAQSNELIAKGTGTLPVIGCPRLWAEMKYY